MSKTEQVIIIGGGPAGYTAALYAARANLNPLVIEGFLWGGLLQETTEVENYPGYPEGVFGPDLMQQFRNQAKRFGARFVTEDVTKIIPGIADSSFNVGMENDKGTYQSSRGPLIHSVFVNDREYHSPVVILAMGAKHRKLGIPGEDELGGHGVSYCATCDAAFFRQKNAIVVGGGDSAMEEAIFLAKFAANVTIVHRRSEFRASPIMLDRARSVKNISWMTPFIPVKFFGEGKHGALSRIELSNTETQASTEIKTDAAFIAIGHEPQSELVREFVNVDTFGYVLTEGKTTKTNILGIFAAGDLVDHTYRQAVTAAGSGCTAALDAEWYLRDNPIQDNMSSIEIAASK